MAKTERQNKVTKAILVVACCGGMSLVSTGAEHPADAGGNASRTNRPLSKAQAHDVTLGGIVVTARRTERAITDSFASVTVIPAEEIMRANAGSIPEVLSRCEGLYVADASGVGTSSKVNLRGFTTQMSGHHLVLVDGVPQNSISDKLVDWNLIPLSNVERIEVVRGPLSTLYGENAMSGVINVVTKDRPADPETMLHASYGSSDTLKWGMRTGRAIGPADYLLSLGQTSTDGYRDHCNADYRHATAKLGVEPDAESRITSWVQYSEVERGAHPWALSEEQIGENRNQARPGTENDSGETHKLNVGMTCEREISDALSLSATGYFRNEDGESFYTSGQISGSTAEILHNEALYGANLACTFEPVLWEIPHTLVAGVDIERGTYDYNKYAAPSRIRADLQSDYDAARERLGIYLEDEMTLVDRLRFLVGGRHSRLDYDFEDHVTAERNHERTLSEESFRAGASYAYRTEGPDDASPETGVLFANISQAFRSPTLGQMFTYQSANPDLLPETTISYEIGIRDQIADLIALRISGYWMEVEDEIAYDYASGSYGNHRETSHRGVEMGVDAHLTSQLGCFANYTYTDARNETGANDGRDLPHVPQHMGNVGLDYAQGSTWGGSLTAHLIGSSYLDDQNSATLPSYATVDLRGWYAPGPFRIFANVANLLDEEYSTYGFLSFGERYYSPAPGTTFSAGLSTTF